MSDTYVDAINRYLADPRIPAHDALRNVVEQLGLELTEEIELFPVR
jgi:hypothetical protein